MQLYIIKPCCFSAHDNAKGRTGTIAWQVYNLSSAKELERLAGLKT
jgi:hypothetical protein